ncbi:methyltransferase domain-containing protein [Halorubrum sp. SD626R]|uniref:protein-L-isoaspartate O-methyltransferase family protein n=1 Tax=Halorubrum TaxID=56688 RepID=UPI0010F736EA|nr:MULTISPECIES: methyltransferase [Halorubrum]TKX77993.1 methyltransferase domain-containing protein [Halorubrum sp. SD626R]
MDEASIRADAIEGLEHKLDEPLDASVLTALQRVSREAFVDDTPREGDSSHGGDGASGSLSTEVVVRLITALEAAEGDEVLVVGAGGGYSVAMLAEIAGARHVHAVDIDREAVWTARSNLAAAGYDAVLVDRRDGANGLPEYAPYDRILLEAAVVEPPRALRDQLAADGRLVYPRGTAVQTIAAIEPDADGERDAGSDPDADLGPDAASEQTRARPSTEDDTAPPGFSTVETAGPVRIDPMLVDGEQGGVERNRTRREDAEWATQGHFAPHGWEQEWIDWDDRL